MTLIRAATPADSDRLDRIQSAALEEPWPELLSMAVDGPGTVLVVEDGLPVGYALLVPDNPVAYLAEFAVAPGMQGEGYGTALMDGTLDRLRSAAFERVRLTARADDGRARSFYDGFDFSLVERIPDHYEDGDAVVLVREL